jgi:hypothetical protein
MKADKSADCAGRWGGRLFTGLCFYFFLGPRNRKMHLKKLGFRRGPFLVLLVNDSEYSRSTGAKPILSLSCIYLVSPGALLLLLLRQLRIFAAAAARAPPTPPPFLREGSTKRKNRL